ncbi:amidase [Cellulomonas shaoxiangyii]|uniref:amidase n=1 Tax=Cellulomonas shaoxiangyii TaxID=2566013 RepID=UPI001AA070AB|nr:amidase [Cellulomonas shaoxiangyii]
MFDELTIDAYHRALRDRTTTATALVQWYLDRIEAHDRSGAALNSVVTVNPEALARAAELDAELARTDELSGPLHGVPVLVKDQAETAGLRTTFGSKLFADYVPEQDATLVTRLKEAGAIVLGKTTMCDFAAGWFSSSSMTGHTKNAYDSERDSGGSSAGSGTATSANLCLVAIGEDTGGSIRIPTSFNNVVGMRVTTGLVPRTGFSPLVKFQDTAGPVARTVTDAARLLDVLVGYDPADEYTVAATLAPDAGRYHESLASAPELASFRLGVLESAFGSDDDPESRPVNVVLRGALERAADAGATVRRGLAIDDLPGWVARTSAYSRVARADITRFLESRPTAPASSFAAVYESGVFHPENDLFHDIATGPEHADDDPAALAARVAQDAFRRAVLRLFAEDDLDVLVYPTVQVVPPTTAQLADGTYTALRFPTNTVIASQTSLPAITVPAGFTAEGLPVGLEVLGRPFSEARLLQVALRLEELFAARRAPALA